MNCWESFHCTAYQWNVAHFIYTLCFVQSCNGKNSFVFCPHISNHYQYYIYPSKPVVADIVCMIYARILYCLLRLSAYSCLLFINLYYLRMFFFITLYEFEMYNNLFTKQVGFVSSFSSLSASLRVFLRNWFYTTGCLSYCSLLSQPFDTTFNSVFVQNYFLMFETLLWDLLLKWLIIYLKTSNLWNIMNAPLYLTIYFHIPFCTQNSFVSP